MKSTPPLEFTNIVDFGPVPESQYGERIHRLVAEPFRYAIRLLSVVGHPEK